MQYLISTYYRNHCSPTTISRLTARLYWNLPAPGLRSARLMKKPIDSIESVIADVKKGRMVVVVDDARRENEGDLIMAAEHVTPEAVNFMTKYGRGLICVPTT